MFPCIVRIITLRDVLTQLLVFRVVFVLHPLYGTCTVPYCTVLCCAVLCCAVLYCAVLCCTVLYCTVLFCAVLCCTVLYCTVLFCAVLYCTVLYCTVLYCTVLYSVLYLYCILKYVDADEVDICCRTKVVGDRSFLHVKAVKTTKAYCGHKYTSFSVRGRLVKGSNAVSYTSKEHTCCLRPHTF